MLIGRPRFAGADQGAKTLSRVDTQMSLLGVPDGLGADPGRFEKK